MDIIYGLDPENIKYISMHAHTIRSIGDAIIKIEDYIKKAKKMGLSALAITNHGTMSDVFQFYKECKANDIKPIIGCEIYVCNRRLDKSIDDNSYTHLVLIAKNEKGFKNLLAIHNDAQLNGFYYKPRTDLEFLSSHGEGIIALSACIAGELPQRILKASKNEQQLSDEELQVQGEGIIELVNTYKSIFDSFYLELQPGDFGDQAIVNEAIVELAEETKTKLIVTNDIHYLNKEDYISHNIHVCAQRKIEPDKLVYADTCYYMMTKEEIIESFSSSSLLVQQAIPFAINNINAIINDCEDLNIIPTKLYMPEFPVPKGHTEDTFLSDLCFTRFDEIHNLLADPAEYTERLLYELETIAELGFSGYFLTVRDFIMYAKDNDIPVGPGRGSVCGSLVAFFCDITSVDPIRYNLLFERFISIHRKGSVPD